MIEKFLTSSGGYWLKSMVLFSLVVVLYWRDCEQNSSRLIEKHSWGILLVNGLKLKLKLRNNDK